MVSGSCTAVHAGSALCLLLHLIYKQLAIVAAGAGLCSRAAGL